MRRPRPGRRVFELVSRSEASGGTAAQCVLYHDIPFPSVFDASESSEDRRLFTIVHGVREDCVRLLQQFEARQSLRFNDFSACWRDMMFSHILSGRTIVAERIEYLQKTMAIAVRLFVNGQDIIRKVGALYLMYGLYMKIGVGERILVGIRVTPLVWAALKEVRELAVQQNHHDVLFVIDKLLFMSAFVFVAQDRELAPDLLHRSAKTDAGDEDAGDELEEESPLQEYLEDGGLQQLSTLHTKYEAIKQQLFKGANIERISSLGADVAPDIQRRLEAIIKGKSPAAAEAAAEQDKPTTRE
ncbi:snRNA-activating protein complex subunit 1 [Amphibalanus amphitrite]|uniref:snRNA-activating protein complex subunit 1 n=1 Tax=Amphibalanus amphitrite TaxID=1232801 RepID=A0A6A4WND2_AMPAM|nr:snRNA-activating protein complex subunit 1 [Amphibalanus amphitrite]